MTSGGAIADLSTLPGGPIGNLPGPYYATAMPITPDRWSGATGIGNAWVSTGSAITYLPRPRIPHRLLTTSDRSSGVVGSPLPFNFTVATILDDFHGDPTRGAPVHNR